jgi:hypothetical protein
MVPRSIRQVNPAEFDKPVAGSRGCAPADSIRKGLAILFCYTPGLGPT